MVRLATVARPGVIVSTIVKDGQTVVFTTNQSEPVGFTVDVYHSGSARHAIAEHANQVARVSA